MDIELEKLKKLEHALHDAIDILRDWQVEEAKPEEKKWIAYLVRSEDGKGRYLSACREDRWESVQKKYCAKTKLFIGTESEVEEWYVPRQKFTDVIKAWEDGKKIQVKAFTGLWYSASNPDWNVDTEYRVKPEEKEEKKWRPYESPAEMICDFKDRYNAICSSFCEPLIWVKTKSNDARFLITGLITGFGKKVSVDGVSYSLDELFKYYAYLDGSPIGMEVKE